MTQYCNIKEKNYNRIGRKVFETHSDKNKNKNVCKSVSKCFYVHFVTKNIYYSDKKTVVVKKE